jgi:hypothetical protein
MYLGVDLVEDEVAAAFDAATEVVIGEAYGEAGEGKEGNDPAMGFAGVGGPIEADEEDGGGGASQQSCQSAEDKPASGVANDSKALDEGADLLQQ